jgi:hypothetical protein
MTAYVPRFSDRAWQAIAGAAVPRATVGSALVVLAACSATCALGCAGSDNGADPADAFVGTWMSVAESGSYICDYGFSGPVGLDPGPNTVSITKVGPDVIAYAPTPCSWTLTVDGNKATATPGASCTEDDGSLATLTSMTLELSSDGSTITENTDKDIVPADFTDDCHYMYIVTETRCSGRC